MPDVVRLVLGADRFEGWKAITVRQSMQTGSGSFELGVSERWPGQPKRVQVLPGSACEVRIDDALLLTGYVDEVELQLDGQKHEVRVRGRDRVGDLIDCAPDHPPSEWLDVSLLTVCEELCKPFGIPVSTTVDLGARLPKATINPGERAFEAIEQLCRQRQVLPLSDGRGGLVLTRAAQGSAGSAIHERVNLIGGSARYAHQERFSEIIVKGQAADASGLLGLIGLTEAAGASGRAIDKGIKRHRPLLTISDKPVDSERATKRAAWEVLTRTARATSAQLTVRGWRTQAGALWPLNSIVNVESPSLGLSGDYLITDVTYTVDGQGTVTQLGVMRPDAFTVQPSEVEEVASIGDLQAPRPQAPSTLHGPFLPGRGPTS